MVGSVRGAGQARLLRRTITEADFYGNVIVTGRRSPHSLYSEKVVTFEDDQGAYDQRDAAGFVEAVEAAT